MDGYRRLVGLLLSLGCSLATHAQRPSLPTPAVRLGPIPRVTTGQLEGGWVGTTGGAIPFWLRANQYGSVPLAGSTATLRAGIVSEYRPVRVDSAANRHRKLDWGYGVDLVVNAGQTTQLLLAQAYLKGRWGQFELYAGRRRGIVGLVDTTLTSGSYSQSDNALPIPKVQIGTRGFVALPFTKGLLAFHMFYNYGWFENADRKVINTRLHQKALYLQLGKPHWRIKLYGGLNHQVVWGGYSPYLANNVSNKGFLPADWRAYYYVVTALPYPTTTVDPNVSSFDEGNRIGNHLGSLDLGVRIHLKAGRLLLYRQNPYDTGALVYLTSLADGLNGISFRRQRPGKGRLTLDGMLLEWLYTKSQGGPLFIIGDPNNRGRVNYFNNSQYIDGWTYYNRTIGTPFLTPQTEVSPRLPVGFVVANNRVSLWHLGLSGQVAGRMQWQVKLAYSQNFGTYDVPYPTVANQFSGLLNVSMPLRIPRLGSCHLIASAAIDQGQLLTNSSGLYIGLRQQFNPSP